MRQKRKILLTFISQVYTVVVAVFIQYVQFTAIERFIIRTNVANPQKVAFFKGIISAVKTTGKKTSYKDEK